MPKRSMRKRSKTGKNGKTNKYLGMLKTLIDQQRSGMLRKTLNYTARKLKLSSSRRRK